MLAKVASETIIGFCKVGFDCLLNYWEVETSESRFGYIGYIDGILNKMEKNEDLQMLLKR